MRQVKKYGICRVSMAPIRRFDKDQSEMISQLLFGEKVEVLIKKHTNWAKIRCLYDDYAGWIDKRMIYYIDEKTLNKYNQDVGIVAEFAQGVTSGQERHCLTYGSELSRFDGMSFKTPFGKFLYNGQFIYPAEMKDRREMIVKLARRFLNCPYLWGGRSPFGIDCSGFTQIVYKMAGIKLPRDAKDQVLEGDTLDFVIEAQPGDLAFFVKDQRVHHVGIILEDNMIIHASGYVRIDKLDHFGIYNKQHRDYTHQLRICKTYI